MEQRWGVLYKPGEGNRLLDLDGVMPLVFFKRIYKNSRSSSVGRAFCVRGTLLRALYFLTYSLKERSCCPLHGSHFRGTPRRMVSRPRRAMFKGRASLLKGGSSSSGSKCLLHSATDQRAKAGGRWMQADASLNSCFPSCAVRVGCACMCVPQPQFPYFLRLTSCYLRDSCHGNAMA